MFKDIGRNHRLIMLALFIWALGEGLWYSNFRQLFLVELGATEAQVGLSLALEAAVRAVLPIPAGYLADRFGARRVMIAAWMLGTIGPFMIAFATTWQMVIPGLIVYAISGFAVPSISLYILRNIPDNSPPGTADRVLTLIYAVYPAGLIISPALGGILADAFSIRLLLWLSSGIFVLSTLITLFTTPAKQNTSEEKQHSIALFRNPAFLKFSGFLILVMIAFYISNQLIPNYLQEVRGLSFSQIGFLYSVMSVGAVIANLAAGKIRPKWNFAVMIGVISLAVLGVWLASSLILLGAAFLALGALFVLRTLATARIAAVVDPRHQGLAFGSIETILSIAMALGAGAAGQLYELTPAHTLPFIVTLAAAPFMLILWFVVWSGVLKRAQPGGFREQTSALVTQD